MPTPVADCVATHLSWFTARAHASGGRVWNDGLLTWAWVPSERTLHGLFPGRMPQQTAERGIREARRLGARSVAVWSAADIDRPELLAAGFEHGWQPWWMTASVTDIPTDVGTRVRLTPTARPDDQSSSGLLALPGTWRAEAQVDGRYAGRAWIHLDGELAGLFDLEVWPRFQRQGLGSELLALVVRTARENGARRVALNATPEGEHLYRISGFNRVGAGRTWWWHRTPWWRSA